MDTLRYMMYGNIYSDTYEHYSDGGPKCYYDMTLQFRIVIATFSSILAFTLFYKFWGCIKQSQEMHNGINRYPSIIEILVGLACWGTYLVQFAYKLYTGRGVFINNPCHLVLLMQGYLLLFKKSKFSGVLFICMLRWLYGVFSALQFPVTTGMTLPLEVEFFWIEHILGALIAPFALSLNGRYFYFEARTFIQHQLFGFYSHILYQRAYMLPLSLLTWANLNFTLCRPDADPFVPIIGNWYYLWSEIYLNLVSVVAVWVVVVLTMILRWIFRLEKYKQT